MGRAGHAEKVLLTLAVLFLRPHTLLLLRQGAVAIVSCCHVVVWCHYLVLGCAGNQLPMLMFLANSYVVWLLLLQGALYWANAISLMLALLFVGILKLRMIPWDIFVAQFL